MRVVDIELDDVLDEFLQCNHREVRSVDPFTLLVNVVELLTDLDELLLIELVELGAETQGVHKFAVFLIKDFIDVLLALIGVFDLEHALQRLLDFFFLGDLSDLELLEVLVGLVEDVLDQSELELLLVVYIGKVLLEA